MEKGLDMKKRIGILLATLILLTGCQTVPESVMDANRQRLEETRMMMSVIMEAQGAKPMVEAIVNLPPGTYEVPEGFELARVTVHEPITAIALASLDKTDWQISENVAITVTRVLAPLAGFIAGGYFNNQGLKTLTGVVGQVNQTSGSLGSQAIAKEPTVVIP